MFGFFFGTACLMGLVFMFSRRRRRGRWKRRGFDRVMDHLDASEAQRSRIREVVDEVVDEFASRRERLQQSRREVADALREPEVDTSRLEAVAQSTADELGQLGTRLGEAMARIAETLDEEQRTRLASWLESRGCSRRGGGHPYRSEERGPVS